VQPLMRCLVGSASVGASTAPGVRGCCSGGVWASAAVAMQNESPEPAGVATTHALT
jgi:hypothetical protein